MDGYWLYTIPNFILAAAMYTIMGRFLLSLVMKPDSEMVMWKVFRQLTDPILHFVRALTPRVAPDGLVMIFSIFWIVLLRIMLLIAAVVFGFAPRFGS